MAEVYQPQPSGHNKEVFMGVVAWLIIGLVIGLIGYATALSHDSGGSVAAAMIGAVGAFLGGFLGMLIGNTGLNSV